MRLRAWFGGLPITCKNYATHVFLHVFYMPRVFLHATCLIPFGPCTGAAYTEGCSFLLQCGIAMCVRPPHNSHTHTHTHTHIHTHTHTRTHTRTHIQTPLPTHPLLHQALHPLPHTETHTNTHTHTRRYTYMYTAHSTQTHTPSSTHLLLHQALHPLLHTDTHTNTQHTCAQIHIHSTQTHTPSSTHYTPAPASGAPTAAAPLPHALFLHCCLLSELLPPLPVLPAAVSQMQVCFESW